MRGADGFWYRLGPAERAVIERNSTRRAYEPGTFLCRQGDHSRHVLVVRSGTVRVLATTSDGREVMIAVRTIGDILGELAALDAGPRSATLQALDRVEVLALSGARFASLCQTEPRLAWALLGVVAGRLRDTGRQWAEFGGGSALRRVAALLLEMAVLHGRTTGAGVEIVPPATQEELASTAAMSRESYVRVLRDLRERGLISTGRRQVIIHRIADLQRLAR
jgi:CRP/FNR family cyclic AMP-dependent transcriptional regulator